MATMNDEKKKALIALLGPTEAARVLAQAAQTEKAADQAGIAYKERRSAAAPFADVPTLKGISGTMIGDVIRSA